ncbi:MAG: putative manganese-dependent inorganic diphosphatase [Verrucomicrobiota bacterium]
MSSSELLVIGHRNPDTDAICSAIGYAEFKRRTGAPHAVAARCGDTNDRIDFVLQTFGMPPPRFVADVSPKIRDVMQRELVAISSGATLVEALGLMEDKGIRVLPVLNEERVCRGLVSVFKMNKLFCPTPNRLFDSRRVLASVANVARTLGAEVITAREVDREEDLILMITVMDAATFATRLENYPPEKLLVITGDRSDIQELALEAGVRLLVVTGGVPLRPTLAKLAADRGVSVLMSPHDTATTTMFCRGSVQVEHMIHERFLSFREDESLADARSIAANSNFHAFPVLDGHKRMIGILAKSDFLRKVERKIILVDHNEVSQAVPGAEEVEIVEIIDHHRLGTIATSQPILFRNEPVGSTSTIVADCFFRHQVDLPRPIAGLLLAGLVSDTLNLTSPTSTERDAQILKRLEQIAGIDASAFTEKLFASGSVLTSLPAAQAITIDCKEFNQQGKVFSVAQIEEMGFTEFWRRKEELVTALEDYRREKSYLFSALLVTDVVKKTSLLLVTGSAALLNAIAYPEKEEGVYELAGIVSRKKQVLPYLIHCLEGVSSKR